MEIQKLKISEEERQIVSSFMREEYPLEIDFNWLMPVVEKIKEEAYNIWNEEFTDYRVKMDINLWHNQVTFVDQDTGTYPICNPIISEKLIDAVWLAVVEFIKWYNENK